MIVDAEIDGRPGIRVRIEDDRVDAIAPNLSARAGERVFDARGGALLPGLHDHHIHLQATARAATSIDCGPPAVENESQLVAALGRAASSAPPNETLRGIGYHESVAGDLDAARLDRWVSDRPLRVQHRTGALWMFNRAALARLDAPVDTWPEGAERDARGRPTGRFHRLDDWLREQLGGAKRPDLAPLSRALAAHGITGVTDTTPTLDDDDAAYVRDAIERGALMQRAVLMGCERLSKIDHARIERGPLKIILDEPALPDLDALAERMARAHAAGRPVAVHCVTRAELALAYGAFEAARPIAGDRIEHASVAPPAWVELIAGTPITVVTQPNFVYERGDRYLEDVDPDDRPWLYRGRGWLEAGVPLAAGSDAPYGGIDPWRAMAAAGSRQTRAGQSLSSAEALSPEESLALFTSDPLEPGVKQRRIEVGARADLVALDAPWRTARTALATERVALTVAGGRIVHARSDAV